MIARLSAGAAPDGTTARPVTETPRHLSLLARIAVLVALGDYVTKEAASRLVGGNPTVFSDWLQFAVVHNPAGAFGLSVGPYTWQLNLALTIAAIVLMLPVSRDLSRVDPLASRALGLVVGGALGNFVSLVGSPHGVVDFIALSLPSGTGLVLNVADVAAYTGLAMILRTGFLIVAEMRRTARPVVHAVPASFAAPRLTPRFTDREVRLPTYHEGGLREIGVVDMPEAPGVPLPAPAPQLDDRPVRVLPFPRAADPTTPRERVLTVPARERGRSGRRR